MNNQPNIGSTASGTGVPSDRPVALVTGATGGMGRAIALDLARDHVVIALGRKAREVAELGRTPFVDARVTDLLDAEAVAGLTAGLERLDVLVHAAALSQRRSVSTAEPSDWQAQFDVNVFAPAQLTRLVLPLLRASRGQVVFLNAGAGDRGVPGHTVYAATKHALHAVADGLRGEEAANGVRVATVTPGPTDTEMYRDDFAKSGGQDGDYPKDRLLVPSSVARAVRLVVDATADSQVTQVTVRPRIEL